MKKCFSLLLAQVLFIICATAAASAGANNSPETAQKRERADRNVILIIGDGMDDHQITIARNYLTGARGRLSLDHLPLRATAQVLTVSNEQPDQPVYVADSANSATALATGQVTSRGRIATTAGSDNDIPTIVELAEAAGLKTGIVTSASVTDATPASFYAHVNMRSCENSSMMKDAMLYDRVRIDCSQDMKANGGRGSIAEQLISSGLDVALGGGLKHFELPQEGLQQTVLSAAVAEGFEVVKTADSLSSLKTDKRLLGLFSSGTMPVRLRGEDGREAEKPEPSLLNSVHWTQGEVTMPEPMLCEPEPASAETPSLSRMTQTALTQLSKGNERGIFLMVESASIDKQSHRRRACGSIGEVEQLNEVLDTALAFAEQHPRTLIIVTADHGQAAQLVPNISLYDAFGVPVFTPGKIVRIRTPENALMAINYATNDIVSEEHTGVNVPLFANAEGLGRVPPMVTQPEIFHIIRKYLAL